jgi:hypothetical protein
MLSCRIRRTLSRDEGEDLILKAYMSEDFREGMDAFLNNAELQGQVSQTKSPRVAGAAVVFRDGCCRRCHTRIFFP